MEIYKRKKVIHLTTIKEKKYVNETRCVYSGKSPFQPMHPLQNRLMAYYIITYYTLHLAAN